MKKIKLNSFIKRCLMITLFASLILVFSLFGSGKLGNDSMLFGTSQTYAPLQYEIGSINVSESNYITMESLYTTENEIITSNNVSVSSDNIVLISTAYDLYALSFLSNTDNSSFLTYHYELASNIDYSNINYQFIPIAWNPSYNDAFTGTFDGNGFEIRNLRLLQITQDNEAIYEDMVYYSMFSYNNGRIVNLGLVNSSLVTNASRLTAILGVAPLVGLNMPNGEISHCYAKDLRDPVTDEEAGIVTAGGYQISGLVSDNEGVFKDSYVAYSIVCNYSITDYIDFSEILTSSNSGTNSNLYFYNSTIDTYSVSDGREVIAYDRNLVGRTFTRNSYGAVRVETIAELNTSIRSTDTENKWFTESYYANCSERIKNSFNIETPILRGLSYTASNDVTSFNIESLENFLYAFELMNDNAVFASNGCRYVLKTDIDLSAISQELYEYTQAFNATFEGAEINTTDKTIIVTDIKNNSSVYPTIYNARIDNRVIVEGIECYGFLPWLTGKISNINFYYTNTIDYIDYTANISKKAIGLVSGYVEGGTIDNVNAYGNISITNNIGKYIMGGICGILTDRGNVNNSTVTGSIAAGSGLSSYTDTTEAGYVSGNVLGGAIGYSTYTTGDITSVLSAVNLSATTFSSASALLQHIGGVVGAGYTQRANNLTNKGSITIGSSTNSNIGTVYAAGVIGRHLGIASQVEIFYNQGDITMYANSNSSFISGVSNVELVSSSDILSTSRLKNEQGKIAYLGTSLTNAATFNIYNSAANTTISGVLNINASNTNRFISELFGVYNVAYKFDVDEKVAISDQTFDMYFVNKYAPCLVTSANSTENSIKLSKAYNLRNLTFTTSNNITATELLFSGCVLGKYIDYEDVRNEGDLSFTFTNGATSSNRNLYVCGVFEEITSSYKANQIYNGGNITVLENASRALYMNFYISGICYQNLSVITSDTNNPLNASYDSTSFGSLNSAINKGNISITSSGIVDTLTSNQSNASTYHYGNVYASGIVINNSGIISNTFNLGDIFNSNYAKSAAVYTYESSGIANQNIGEYAQIRDSANNGVIKAYSISRNASYTHAAGIVIKNTESRTNYKQIVSFTINYGEVYAFNSYTNQPSASVNTHAKAAGIMAIGVCNVINTVNYGNIFSSESAGGMMGVVDLSSYSVSSTEEVIIANTLNYGIVKAIAKYRTVDGAPVYITYQELKEVSPLVTDYLSFGLTTDPFNQYIGALISIINFNNQNVLKIRYLINFFENVQIICSQLNTPATASSEDARLLVNVSPNNRFMGQNVTYAPLSTIDDENGNIGVFSYNFIFMRAINGNISSTEITDSYIADFFQFVNFEKINDSILDMIGWRTIAYIDASERFAQDLDSVVDLITRAGITSDLPLVSEALTSTSWINNCDTTVLDDLLTNTLGSSAFSSDDLKELVKYLFFESTARTTIVEDLRKQVVEYIVTESNTSLTTHSDQVNFLNTIIYDELLAKVIAGTNFDYSKVLQAIKDNLNSMSTTALYTIIDSYIALLDSDSAILNDLFNGSLSDYYISSKIATIDSMLKGIPSAILKEIFNSLEVTESLTTKFSLIVNEDEEAARDIFINVTANNQFVEGEAYVEVMSNLMSKYMVADTVSNELNNENSTILTNFNSALTSNLSNITLDTSASQTSLNVALDGRDYSGLWNLVKNNDTLQNYLNTSVLSQVYSVTGEEYPGLYAKATEYRNSYQSNDAPSDPTSTTGLLRATQNNTSITTRFIYTPDSVASQLTHYYGPYTTVNNTIWDGTGDASYNLGFELYNTGTVAAQSTQRYVPIFISLDESFLQQKINGTLNSTIYEFYWNNARHNGGTQGGASASQWVSTHIIAKRPTDSQNFLIKNYNVGAEYLYYDFDNVAPTSQEEFTTDNPVPGVSGLKLITDSTGQLTANQGHPYSEYYLTGYCSASIITGIWYQQNIWVSANELQGAFLTAKENETQRGYRGVHTTQYIDYSLTDLINLDGVLTKGKSDGRMSNDEIVIINSVMQQLLSTAEGQKAVLLALAMELENGFTASQGSYANILLGSLIDTAYAVNAVEDIVYENSSLTTLTYNNRYALYAYLSELAQVHSFTLNDQIKISSVEHQENFLRVLKALAEYNKHTKDYLYDIENSQYYDFIYDYLSTLNIDNLTPDDTTDDISEAVIDNLFTAVSASSDFDEIRNYLSRYNNIDISGMTYDNYTFSGEANSKTWNAVRENTRYDGVIYQYSVSALTDATISCTMPIDSQKYFLDIVHSGTISVDSKEKTNNNVGLSTWLLDGNTSYNISVSSGAKIYSIDLVDSREEQFSFSKALPYATITGGTQDADSYVLSNSVTITITIENFENASSVVWDSIQVAKTNSWAGDLVVNYNDTSLTQSLVEAATLYPQNIALNSNTITITKNAQWGRIDLYDLILTYQVLLEDDTVLTFTQNVIRENYVTADYSQSSISHNSTSATVYTLTDEGTTNMSVTNNVTSLPAATVNYPLTVSYDPFLSFRNNNVSGWKYSFLNDYAISFYEDNFNNYTPSSISNIGQFLIDNLKETEVRIDNPNTVTSITVSNNAYVLIKAETTGAGSLTLNSVNRVVTNTPSYYCFYIASGGTYNLVKDNASVTDIVVYQDVIYDMKTIGTNTTISYILNGYETVLFSGNYEDLPNFRAYLDTQIPNSTNKYLEFLNAYKYLRKTDTLNSEELYKNDCVELATLLFAVMRENVNLFDYFISENFSDQNYLSVIDFINLFGCSDYASLGSSLDKLIDKLTTSEQLTEVLIILLQNTDLRVDLISQIQNIITTNNYTECEDYFVAAYVGNDYIHNLNNNTLQSSILYTILQNYDSGNYQFITSETEIDNLIFGELMDLVGFNLNTEGYGIYALSSSKGILNGQFIPDNLPLDSMDTNYDDVDGYITLTDPEDKNTYWRGGATATTSLQSSVSDGFLNDMKQLKLSISTTVFELELKSETNEILYSSEELIDLESGNITYYVPTAYGGKTFTYSFSSIANGATISADNFSITPIEAALDIGVSDTFVVTAEDYTITKTYTVTIVCIDMDYQLALTDSPVASSGSNLTITVSETATDKLPKGLDVAPYITIQNLDNVVMEDTFTIASDTVVDERGYSQIIINVNTRLPFGTYKVVLSLFDIPMLTKSVEFEKEPSTECEIIDFEFEGYPVEFNTSNEATSEIDFGRGYTRDELESFAYLTYISYSDCATVEVNASYNTEASITTYTVEYIVTAENGNTNRYYHYLVERSPDISPVVYKDGKLESNVTSSGYVVNVNFNRGEEPSYRVKYNLNNFYMDSGNIVFDYNITSESTNGVSASASFAGMSIDITNIAEPGTYTFSYIYQNTILWDSETVFEKTYAFPDVIVTKNYSQDALLKTITFLDTNVVLSNLRTVMYPDYAIISHDADAGSIDVANEQDYYDIRSSVTPKIGVDVKSINYNNNNHDYSTSTNFYSIGSIANAQLSSYTPTFSIEEHAEVYQYTTLKKLTSYGLSNNQQDFDTAVLNTTSTEDLYLYVPFIDENNNEIVFIVQVESGVWTNVYLESFRGEEAAIATYDKQTSSFSYNGLTYTKSIYAGTVNTLNNRSLYMDYIGTPLDNHFWYVSYAVFSEDYIKNYSESSTVKFFHVSIIDATNTIYFEVTVNSPSELNVGDIYLLIVDREYSFNETTPSLTRIEYISAFATAASTVDGITTYYLETSLQVIPRGYFYFYLDLPAGYACEYEITNGRNNTNTNNSEVGGYLPPSSLVTQRVEITFNIFQSSSGVIWGESTAEAFGVMATEKTN